MSSQLKTAIALDDSLIVDGLTIDAINHTTPLGEAEAQLREGQASVSSADTHIKHLEDALVGASGKTKFTKLNTGANEQLEADLDATGITAGYVATANGSGGWGWGAVGGGGATPVDVTIIAGEDLALRDYVYLDESSGTWFKLDTDATPVKCGRIRGVVNSGAILDTASGTVRLIGEVSGFAGLTAWQPVYADTSPGGITQTRPSPVSGGAQVAIVEVGIATSTTNILVMPAQLVQYMKRNDSLADDGTLTIQHHADPMGHKRRTSAYIGSSTAGATITEYTSANQDTDKLLRAGGAGGTTTPASSGASGFGIGNAADWRNAQIVLPNTGELTEITFELLANTGTPTGTLTWEIREYDGTTTPSTLITSGTHSPTPSATNTITVSDGTVLDGTQSYWFMLYATSVQSSGNYWLWNTNNANPYADGFDIQSLNGGSSWTAYPNNDAVCSITTSNNIKDKHTQTITLASDSLVNAVKLYLKKEGTPTGTLTIRLETLSSGDPSGTLVDVNATATLAESSLTGSYALYTITFADTFTLTAGSYAIVLSTDRSASATDYISWGADASSPSYAGGEMKSEAGAVWSSESADAIFALTSPGTTFVEPAIIGRASGSSGDVTVRYDDGIGTDASTKTTFQNIIGASADVTAVVEVS